MSIYNHHFVNHFGSCRLLATGRDPHRNRDVEVRMVPGQFDIVGMTDGTDAWIAPASSPFLSHVKKILEAIQRGEDPKPAQLAKPRRQVIDEAPEPEAKPRPRRAVIEDEPEVKPRRRAHVPA